MSNPHADDAETPERREQLNLERALRAQMATVTGGLAPDVYVNAWWDWLLNLAKEPPQQLKLAEAAIAKAAETLAFAAQAAATREPLSPAAGDARFEGTAWSQWPFNVYAHTYRNYADWWQDALAAVPGVAPENKRTLEFMARNALEALSPANYLATNPELLDATRAEAGENLARGFGNWLEDIQRTLGGKTQGSEKFVIGRDIAATPGKVVLRNDLIELIQYSPATETVFAEPILIIPAWIMKYYILDLSANNSLVSYLVSQGHTVFMVSWKNPTESDRNLGMDDYLRLGIRAAFDAVSRIVPERKIHSVGYCIGGTLLSIAEAVFAAEGDLRTATMSLLAAQQDFSEPGELSLFISPSQIDMLEAVMNRTGVLKSEQMGGAFSLLRARDLLWTPAVNSTRMPCRMHSEYLRQLYLDNALARGEFEADGRLADLAGIQVPMFVVGTETDHVAPWKSVYKARGLTRSADYTFLLTSGGHNAGIISGAVHPRRRHRVRTWSNAAETLSPEAWFDSTPPRSGSWWPTWERWLAQHSTPEKVDPPPMGSAAAGYAPLADAPGEYVLQK